MQTPFKQAFVFVLLFTVGAGCTGKVKYEKEKTTRIEIKKEAALEEKSDSAVPAKPLEIKYRAIKNKDSISRIKEYFNDTQLKTILAINRIDYSKLYGAEMLAIPDTFLSDLKYYSPFPDSIAQLDSVRKILLVSYPSQAIGAYECGKLVKWAPNSMGKQSTPTPLGLMHTNWKSKQTVSTDDSTWILKWYFNLDNFRGVSLHQYELPGHPASHACIRLYEEDAEWLYHWADQWKLDSSQVTVNAYGTPVIIFGNYDFSQLPLWYKLESNPREVHVSTDTLSAEIGKYLPLIMKRQTDRDSFLLKLEKPALTVSIEE